VIKTAKPIVIAHRGNSGPAPANTIESIRQAVELGVDMIELDVRSSRDRVPVLIHNDTVDETTDGTGAVSSLELAQLRELDAGSWKGEQYAGERIPTLMEALEFARGKVNLSLDLKDEAIIPAMIRAVQEADMVDDVVICGCYESQAQKVREIDGSITVLLNTDSQLEELAKRDDKSDFVREYIRRACRAKLAALNVSFRHVTYELIRRAHLRALPVWTWTVDKREDMQRLLQMGVDAIYTNWPERLLEVMEQR
jgi:glycerophosphoryl diester phosphodiesterase